MKLEHKIGIGIVCTFLCLCGAVIGLKMQEQTPSPEAHALAGGDPKSKTPEEPTKSPESPKEEGDKVVGTNDGVDKAKKGNPLDGTKSAPKPIDPIAPSNPIPTVKNPSSGPGLGDFPSRSSNLPKPTPIPPGGLTGAQLNGANNSPSASDNPPPLTRPKVEGSSEFGNYTPLSSPKKNVDKSTSSTGPGNSGSAMPKPIGPTSTGSVSTPSQPSIVRTSASDNVGTGTPLMPFGSGNKDQATPATSKAGSNSPASGTTLGGPTSTLPKTTAAHTNISGVGITPPPTGTPSLGAGSIGPKPPATTSPGGGSGISPTGTGTPSPIGASTSSPTTPSKPSSSPASSGVPPYLMPGSTGNAASGGGTSLQPGGPPPLATNSTSIPLPTSPSSTPTPVPLPSSTPSGSPPPSSLMPSTSKPIPPPSFSTPNPTPMSPSTSGVPPLSPSTSSTPPLSPSTSSAPPLSPSTSSAPPLSPPASNTPPPLPTLTPPPAPVDGGSSFVPDSTTSSPRPLSAAPALIPVPIGGSSSKPRPATNEPAVTVYDEQTYTAQSGDTFESISKKFLNSGNYAKALQMHNQNHARAGREMANAGKLTPGEKIYIPPTSILEQRYAGAIASGSPPTIVPAGGTPLPNR